ncbi:DNA helicase [Acetobacteraceae bacterium EV16G]
MQGFGEQSSVEADPEEDVPKMPFIHADLSDCFTYASHQNAVPVLRAIEINNVGGLHLENIRLELTANPAFLRPKTWTIERLIPGDNLPLRDRKIDLDAAYLAGLNEAERGEVTLRLLSKDVVLEAQHFPVRLLARDEWGGVQGMAQLLPAFVMPNDPAVSKILLAAADILEKNDHPSGLDGYQSNSPQRSYMLTAAIYAAIAATGIHYAEPPASFEERGQKVRRPGRIIEEKLATCLDTALLFAAALEGAGLNPVILLFRGHAAVGVWLIKRQFGNTVENDQMEVRKALASHEMVIFETTGVTHRPPITLEVAQHALDHRMSEEAAQDFSAAIDVKRARSGGVTPLASHEAPQRPAEDADSGGAFHPLSLPAIPSFNDLPGLTVEEKPTNAAGRIDRWQKKLLDLTLRNRLLNFPTSKKTIPFLCTDVAYLEDRLADGAAIQIVSLPEQNPIGERDETLYREKHGRDLNIGFAAEALKRDELPSPLSGEDLAARLTEMHRQVRNDFAEGGANTLFLAVGFLRWRKKPEDERSYRAPLLLIPVKLERRSASAPFRLRYNEDDPRFNATLLQFLERDFDLELPQFSGELPKDESGIDVPRILNAMRQAVRDVPGMEVIDETALSTFSFAKYLMWKDLVERTEVLRENRVVAHLIDTPDKPFDDGASRRFNETEIDQLFAPADVINLLPADSSQVAASIVAAEGQDFVLVGPPGTGKSQTIANMIANCLGSGKTVLFVAEKTAALDVVYRRLREHGLGAHCIELHSSKSDRRHFLTQLRAAWEYESRVDPTEWLTINERLKLRRDQLNRYVAALHKTYPNGWTPYLAFGTTLRGANDAAPHFDWPKDRTHDKGALISMEELADNLGEYFASLQHTPAMDLVDFEDHNMGWQDALLSGAESLRHGVEKLVGSMGAFRSTLGISPTRQPAEDEIASLTRLASAIEAGRDQDLSIAFAEDFTRSERDFLDFSAAVTAYREAEQKLTARFTVQAVESIDMEALDRQWQEATASLWPLSVFARQKVTRLLQTYAEGGTVKPENDLNLLRRMKSQARLITQTPLKNASLPLKGLDTNLTEIAEIFEKAGHLRAALNAQGRNTEETAQTSRKVAAALRDRQAHDDVWLACERLLAAHRDFIDACQKFSRLAGRDIRLEKTSDALPELCARLDALADARRNLRDWSNWCRLRNKACAAELGPLIDLIQRGAIPAGKARSAFRLGYARWWLGLIIEESDVLRNFDRFLHEKAIRDFREFDDLVRKHAIGQIISRLSHDLPAVQSVPRKSELGLLRHQMELQRPSQSIRDMISKMPESFPKLAQCMLMSPLSIAQFLPPNQTLFDVVIFDEASQISTWDAVGAIARGRQTIIVGDPKQLPPTNFFGSNHDDEDVAEYEKDMESILDEAKAAGIPVRDLRWHYRSRSESLIAFSNHHYYQGRLVTFPSPQVDDRAVKLRKIPHGVYDRGKSRTNRIEAQAVADEAVSRMRQWLTLPEEERPTLGVITFNAQQQSLILDLIDLARRNEPELEWFFSDDRIEATIVKNLENVQGDERDVILFSITFWKDAAGKVFMDFGALNRDGGERRLNVAVTRARQELIVFSGFTADHIDVARVKAAGVHDLKAFLDYAERGAVALPAQNAGSVGDYDSPFEEAVAAKLEQHGWRVAPQIGVSGFRIDIGVHHPDFAGAYLAGVECDGATYHSAATARDRDKVREQVLAGLGWNIIRVWSTDWWYDAEGCTERLHQALEKLLAESRAVQAAEATRIQAEAIHPDPEPERTQREDELSDGHLPPPFMDTLPAPADIVLPPPVSAPEPERFARAVMPATPDIETDRFYRITDFSDMIIDPDRFYDPDYSDHLRAMVNAVIATESPLRTDILYQRIARAHGWSRTGGRIRDQIDRHLRDFTRAHESSGEFIWQRGADTSFVAYRRPQGDETRRAVSEIPLAEIASVVRDNPEIFNEADPARDLARLLGVERLAAPARARLEEAIAHARPGKNAETTPSEADAKP